jgi:ABC-type phosphate/phosphonate transport system substrate-binding protein
MIASLRMYEWPHMRSALDRYWELIRAELNQVGLPAPLKLDLELNEQAAWTRPDLCFAQTCGMPFRTQLHDKVTLIGTPDFGVPECPAGFYNSVFIVGVDDKRDTIFDFSDALFAYNSTGSQSGFAAAYEHTNELGFWFERRIASGGHAMSAEMVAKGQADIACLDAVSWRLIQRYAPFAESLRIISTTKPTPGLPYISALGVDQPIMFTAIEKAINKLRPDDQQVLVIKGLEWISPNIYQSVPNPPLSAG